MTANCPWPLPPVKPVATHAEVHVWCAALDPPADRVEWLAGALADDEQLRARRFHFARDRRRYIVARGLLRMILGTYLEVEGKRLEFAYGERGKPYLAAGPGIQFNLSHSGELAVYAVTRGHRVGIDVEQVRALNDASQIARRFFSAAEVAELERLPAEQRLPGFFNCWTRKEAYLKALGEGLALPLDQFTVSLTPGVRAALLAIEGQPDEPAHWSLSALMPAAGHVAAVAVEGGDCRLCCWRWPDDYRP